MSTFASQISLKSDLVSSATLTSDLGSGATLTSDLGSGATLTSDLKSGVLALGERDEEVRLRLLPFFVGAKGEPGGLISARLSLSGDISGSVAFDGNSDVTLETTVVDGGHEHSILDGGHF